MAQLIVSLDQIAALRQVRQRKEPDPINAASLAELAGASGISVHLRPDRRYIRDRDLFILRETVGTRLMIQSSPSDDNIAKILEVKPSIVSLVADHADQDSPVSGIDFANAPIDYSELVMRLKGANIMVNFFVEPEQDAIRGAARAGADAVTINCGVFTDSFDDEEAQEELDRIDAAAQYAAKSNLIIMAARGINYRNVRPLRELGMFSYFLSGHAIVSRAVLTGMKEAVTEMVRIIGVDSASD